MFAKHGLLNQLDRYSTKFVATRSCALDSFTRRLATHPILGTDPQFHVFLTSDDIAGELRISAVSDESPTVDGGQPEYPDPEFDPARAHAERLAHAVRILASLRGSCTQKSTSDRRRAGFPAWRHQL